MEKTREIHDSRQAYRAVVFQPGRVQTDDDHNGAQLIALEERRRHALAAFGPAGTPDDGFAIGDVTTVAGGGGATVDFAVGAGSYFAAGHRAVMLADSRYGSQPDWLNPSPVPVPAVGRTLLVYAESALHPVSAPEDRELFEEALGGMVDTTGRLRSTTRVRVADVGGPGSCQQAWATLAGQLAAAHRGTLGEDGELRVDTRLHVGFTPVPSDDLCTPSASGFAYAENQLLRVQLTGNGLTWGMDNASPLTRVTVDASGSRLTLATAPRDAAHQPRHGQVVEVLPTTARLANGEPVAAATGFLTRVDEPYDPTTRELSLASPVPPEVPLVDASGSALPVFLRLWDRGDDVASPAEIPVTAGTPVPLGTTGLTVTLTGSDRVAGDHWLVAARPASGTVVTPWRLTNQPGGAAPHGVQRFLAPLARITRTGTSAWRVSDCRVHLRHLGRTGCCRVELDPEHWLETLDRLEADSTLGDLALCFAPGEYELPAGREVSFAGRRSVALTGQGRGTVIRARDRERVLAFDRVDHVRVSDLTVLVAGEAAVAPAGHQDGVRGVVDVRRARSARIERVTARSLAAPRPAMACVAASGEYRDEGPGLDVLVHDCVLAPGAGQLGVLVLDAERVRVVGNRVGRPAEIRQKQAPLHWFVHDAGYRRRLLRAMLRDVRPAQDGDTADPDLTTVRFGRSTFAFRSLGGAGPLVARLLTEVLGVPDDFPSDVRWLRSAAAGALGDALAGGVHARQLAPLRARLAENRPPVAHAGVVVAGRRADHVRVCDNELGDTRSGVVVALSHGTSAATAGRVQVCDNDIHLVVTFEGFGLPHRGVQVGHVRSARIDGNQVRAEHKGLVRELAVPTEGVRLWGRLGPGVAVTDSVFSQLSTGLLVRQLGDPGVQVSLRDNLADHVGVEVDQ